MTGHMGRDPSPKTQHLKPSRIQESKEEVLQRDTGFAKLRKHQRYYQRLHNRSGGHDNEVLHDNHLD